TDFRRKSVSGTAIAAGYCMFIENGTTGIAGLGLAIVHIKTAAASRAAGDPLPDNRVARRIALVEAAGGLSVEKDVSRGEGAAVGASKPLSQPLGQSLQRRRTIEWLQPHVQQTEPLLVSLRNAQGLIELFFRFHFEAATGAKNLRQTMVIPSPQVVVRAVLNV